MSSPGRRSVNVSGRKIKKNKRRILKVGYGGDGIWEGLGYYKI